MLILAVYSVCSTFAILYLLLRNREQSYCKAVRKEQRQELDDSWRAVYAEGRVRPHVGA